MEHTYIIVSNTYYFSDNPVTFYGIAAIKERDGRREITDVVFDLSQERDKVAQTVALCNEQKLDVIHLRDIAEDIAAA